MSCEWILNIMPRPSCGALYKLLTYLLLLLLNVRALKQNSLNAQKQLISTVKDDL